MHTRTEGDVLVLSSCQMELHTNTVSYESNTSFIYLFYFYLGMLYIICVLFTFYLLRANFDNVHYIFQLIIKHYN